MLNQIHDLAQQTTYQQLIINSQNLRVIPVSRQVLIEAVQLRASINIKLPDAIHAATALLTQCSTFLTNDQRFRSVPNLSVILLSETNSA
ncbi:type II toxin-antitoxin system VapC family toxin [Nostoc sp.]|uniref:type II toxin-antitoxin system VapC family toxin n=1 Tax=Nostoc sp. TaxID=1180 RepID=UPI002FF5AC00